MPAAICHYLHAQQVLDHLKKTSYEKIEEDAFILGAQGPDFLFCFLPMPWRKGKKHRLSKYGLQLHQLPPGRTLTIMRDFCQMHPDLSMLRSYMYGFLCHYSFDRTAHPYIKFGAYMLLKQHPKQTHSIFHHHIEAALDTILLRYETGALPPEFNLKKTLPKNSQVLEDIGLLYQYLFKELFHADVPVEAIQNSVSDCRKAFGALNDRTTLKKSFVASIEKKSKFGLLLSSHFRSITEDDKYDYANICEREWQWPIEDGEIHTENFFQVYENAIADAEHLIAEFFDHPDLSDLTQDISF